MRQLLALSSPTVIVYAITDALGLKLAGPQDPVRQLLNALRERKLLLVLDNAEHLLDGVEQYSSVALFIQRARQVNADFDTESEEQVWAVHICRIVEGIPLGIELAAAWVGLLSCEEITGEIEANLGFLAANMRDIP